MISAVRDLIYGVRGVFRMLAFRPGWQSDFDISSGGIVRSFAGIVFALPAFLLLIAGVNFFAASNPQLGASGVSVLEAVLIWARFWLVFPIMAVLVCLVLRLSDRYGGWLVVHNWTIFVLIHVQALIWTLNTAGLGNLNSLAFLTEFYLLARLVIHWRVATAALGVSPALGAAAAGIPLIVDWILLRMIQ